MNKLCFPTGLNVKSKEVVSVLCVKHGFNRSMEDKLLNKIYSFSHQKPKTPKQKPKHRTTRKKEMS